MSPMEQYIREYSASIGLNPDVIMRTVLAEGGPSSLTTDLARQSQLSLGGGQEQSYGPFQLFMGGGVGNRALAAGIDPRDPAQAYRAAKFAMDVIRKEGLGQWHGWKGDPWAAHGGAGTGASVAMPSTAAAGATAAPGDVGGLARGSIMAAQNASPGTPESPYVLPAPAEKTTREKLADAFSEGLGAFAGAKTPEVKPLQPSPAAATFQAEAKPLFQPNDQRQQLAMLALQRLNSGRLVI